MLQATKRKAYTSQSIVDQCTEWVKAKLKKKRVLLCSWTRQTFYSHIAHLHPKEIALLLTASYWRKQWYTACISFCEPIRVSNGHKVAIFYTQVKLTLVSTLICASLVKSMTSTLSSLCSISSLSSSCIICSTRARSWAVRAFWNNNNTMNVRRFFS